MINFDALTLKAFVLENVDYLKNASIRKIQQPTRRELVLHLRNNGENKKFYININPEFFHICLVDELQSRGISIPDAAPMFCMLLRKYILNAKITDIKQPFGERILELYFDYKDALEETSTLCLAIELMGKYSNIVLYNRSDMNIIGCAHNVGEEKSKYRELAGTLPYIYPPAQNKSDILQAGFDEFSNLITDVSDISAIAFQLASEYFYLTVPIVKQAIYSIENFNEKSLSILFEKLQKTVALREITPSVKSDFSEFSLVSGVGFEVKNSVNEMINSYFEYNQTAKILKQKKSKIYTFIDTQVKKFSKQAEIFKEKLLDNEKADNYRIKGDILMMNINSQVLPKVEFENPYDGEKISIELDTRYTIIQNANRYYKLYKKTKTAIEYATNQLEETENQLSTLDEQRFYVDIANTIEDVEEIMSELGIKSDIVTKKQEKKQINLECHQIGDFKVYLGKNSVQNDFLLSKIASPEDLWFHPLNIHGAHVILKKNNSKEVIPNDVLLECAKLAKRFAKTQNDAKIPIIYTERKYVKKANSKIAFVTYKNETEIYC